MLAKVQSSFERLRNRNSSSDEQPGFGTFAGVFTPTVLTILGAIMYLRLGQVVGNAGLLGAVLIILIAHVITVSTAVSVSSIATNTRVGAGGAFAIISRSLGLEVGGAVGVPLFLAQGISIALYVLAFGEGWLRVFPTHSYFWACIVALVLVIGVAYISTSFSFRIQFFILAVVGFSLFSIVLASIPFGSNPGFTNTPVLWGEYPLWDFWTTFSIFFPAVTGIMAGISMSGSLKNPRKSLPLGTMSAIGLTFFIYLGLAYWLSRIATPAELISNQTIMIDKAYWSWAVLAGLLGATFSSALGSLVAAPRVLQALAANHLVPFDKTLAKETDSGEPRVALYATAVVATIAVLLSLAGGGLNAVASIITMFFLITYGMLNLVVFVEQQLNMVSFRPTFKVPHLVPLIGVIGCLAVMFLLSPIFGLVSIILVLAIYIFLARRATKEGRQDDVRSGLFTSLADWASIQARKMPSTKERSWKPSVLIPVSSTGELSGSYRFLRAITQPQGAIIALGIYPSAGEGKLAGLERLTEAFIEEGISAQTILLEDDDLVDGVRASTQVLRWTHFPPNLLFLHLRPDSDIEKGGQLAQLIDKTAAYSMGIVLFARHYIHDMGREKIINVWISPPPDWEFGARAGSNDLAILLALQLQNNWRGRINLCMAVADDEARQQAEVLLEDLLELARMPAGTQPVILQLPFAEALRQATHADLTVLGLPKAPDLAFNRQVVDIVQGSCIFVRDSGEESALV